MTAVHSLLTLIARVGWYLTSVTAAAGFVACVIRGTRGIEADQ